MINVLLKTPIVFIITLSLFSATAGAFKKGPMLRTSGAGSIDPRRVKSIVLKHTDDIKTCYKTELSKNSGIPGKFKIGFSINAMGKSSHITMKGNGDNFSRACVECVQSIFNQMRFPRSTGGGSSSFSRKFDFTELKK